MTRSIARSLLLPLVPAYRLALRFREFRLGSRFEPVKRLRFPVVSVGNLSTGGSGKTPLTIALARSLKAHGIQVNVLSRGYGRSSQIPSRVDLSGTAEDFGDEPLLIARRSGVPVFVAPQRYDAGLLAEAGIPIDEATQMPVVHLLDDGFQHRQLSRDIDILLLNREDLSDSLLPAGNLREPLASLHRATVVAIPEDEPDLQKYLIEKAAFKKDSESPRWNGPVWRLRRVMKVPHFEGTVFAFCGIARPDQFFAGLDASGLKLAGRRSFRDHHPYSRGDLQSLTAEAGAAGAVALLTTEKDLVRMGELALSIPQSMPLTTAELKIEIENEEGAMTWLLDRLSRAADRPSL